MKKKIYSFAVLFLMIFPFAICQTTVPAGEVSGEWLTSGSPYLVEGEIYIPVDKTLDIEPGVVVKFNGHFKFIIYGCLLAEGAPGDSITFTTDDQEAGWHGLRFLDTETNSQPQSEISYCIVENGKSYGTCPDNCGGGIYIGHSNPHVSNSTIRNNSAVSGIADWGGGGIYAEYGNPQINDNLIINNYSGHDGGGIYCGFNSPQIYNNRLVGNEAAYRGGGIATFNFASPEILNNEIMDNQAASIGGGIYQSGGNSLIQSNVITGNYAGDGGGIACYLASPEIYNNLLTDNEAHQGAGLWNQGSSPNIFNNTITQNSASYFGGGMYNISGMAGIVIHSNPLSANNIIYENTAEDGQSIYSSPDNIPVLWHNNVEGLDGTGIYGDITEEDGNMDVDPQFEGSGEHECALTESSLCIDHGINTVSDNNIPLPETDILGNQRIWDGDNDGSAFADIGAYEYDSSPLGIANATTSSEVISVHPNPFTTSATIEYELIHPQSVSITFYNQFGRQVDVIEERQHKGLNRVTWTPENLADGIYYFRLQAGSQLASGKMVLMR
jgi:hypothetical protein